MCSCIYSYRRDIVCVLQLYIVAGPESGQYVCMCSCIYSYRRDIVCVLQLYIVAGPESGQHV